ncbi:hypothetical protein MTO96_039502 [Rhipicephalus appendiculatus]
MLPSELVVNYHKRLSADSKEEGIGIESLRAFLKTEVESRENALQTGHNEVKGSSSKHRDKEKIKTPRGSSASLFSAGKLKQIDSCAFCDAKNHTTHECQAQMSLDEKKRRLTAAGRCFRCGIKGHMSKQCRNKRLSCKHCGRRHLSQMCDPSWRQPENTAAELHSSAEQKSRNVPTVLLQTAQVWAEGRGRALTRLLFDGGSQRSFVTKKLSHELQLEVIGEEDITIYPFGGSGNIIKEKRRRVKIWLRSQRLTTLPDSCSAAEVAQKPGQLTRRWRYRLRMADQFWRRWQKEYLTSLRSAHFTVPNSSSALKQGTPVLVQEHHQPRQLWKPGEVSEVLLGRDGKIRACMVRMPNGAILRRPVQLLYPMEYTDE